MEVSEQSLREIDKWDKVGPDGVLARLTTGLTDQSGAEIPGVGVHPVQAEALVAFIDGRFGAGVKGMETWFDTIGGRFALMTFLDQAPCGDTEGYTLWDKLIDMPVNPDQSWSGDARPENIGWALDDILNLLKSS